MPAPHPSATDRIPRMQIDPIHSPSEALVVISRQLARPLTFETVVLFVDSSGCGYSFSRVGGTDQPEMVVSVADTMAMLASGRADISGLVLTSVRPGGGVLPDDDTLWFEADEIVGDHGLVLYDWLVVGRGGTRSLGDELGVPSRWPSRT